MEWPYSYPALPPLPAPLAHDGAALPRRLALLPVRTDAHRSAVEAFIRARFAEHYDARVRHFMPCLYGLESDDGRLYGALGTRAADAGALFLERYLEQPIEQVLLDRCGAAAARRDIVEVGNLAARGAGAARLLILALSGMLAAQGFRWVVFTATPALRNSFQRLGLALRTLGPADPARMGEEAREWGSYYERCPQVMAGEIAHGAAHPLRADAVLEPGHRFLSRGVEGAHVACR